MATPCYYNSKIRKLILIQGVCIVHAILSHVYIRVTNTLSKMHHKDVPCDCKSSPTNYPNILAMNLSPMYIILSFLRMFYKWNHTICDFLRLAFLTQHKYPGDESTLSCVSAVHPLCCLAVFCWEKAVAHHSSLLPGESQGRGAWGAAVCGVAQSRTRLSDSAAAVFWSTLYHSAAIHSLKDIWLVPVWGC